MPTAAGHIWATLEGVCAALQLHQAVLWLHFQHGVPAALLLTSALFSMPLNPAQHLGFKYCHSTIKAHASLLENLLVPWA